MKKILFISVLLLLFVSFFQVNAVKQQKKSLATIAKPAKVEVYYFHFTRRCVTCQAVESESQKAIHTLYANQYKSGKIAFKSVNLDESSNKALAEKYQVEGQTLLVVSGNKRYDLTEQGFMYARSNPAKFRQEFKEVMDPLIK